MEWILSIVLVLAGLCAIRFRGPLSRYGAEQQSKYFGSDGYEIGYEILGRVMLVTIGLFFAATGVVLLFLQLKAWAQR